MLIVVDVLRKSPFYYYYFQVCHPNPTVSSVLEATTVTQWEPLILTSVSMAQALASAMQDTTVR